MKTAEEMNEIREQLTRYTDDALRDKENPHAKEDALLTVAKAYGLRIQAIEDDGSDLAIYEPYNRLMIRATVDKAANRVVFATVELPHPIGWDEGTKALADGCPRCGGRCEAYMTEAGMGVWQDVVRCPECGWLSIDEV